MSDFEHLTNNLGEDVNGAMLFAHIPAPLALDTATFMVEYGIRSDDSAVVFHFFSPKEVNEWSDDYHMDIRLKRAIDKNFDVTKVSCGYAKEMDSFYVIVGGLGDGPDPWTLVERFFRDVDAPLEAGFDTVSGTSH